MATRITLLLLLLLMFEHTIEVQAQSRVRILQADQLIGSGEEKRILRGNVLLQTEDFTIACDSAYHHQRAELIEAFGNVEITTEDEKIWADYVRHDLRREFSEFRGRVILRNQEATLFSALADFDHQNDIAIFPQHIRMEDENGTLVAESGLYYNKADSAIFRGAVQIADSLQYAEADSMFTNRRAGYYELHGRVLLQDLERNVTTRGQFVQADSTGFRKIRGNSKMMRIREQENTMDTTFVWAERMLVWEEDTTYRFQAFHEVHFWTNEAQSISDSTYYDDTTGLFTLFGSLPKAWFDDIQLSGPRIYIQTEDDEIASILSYERPFTVQLDSATQRLHQITGDTIFVHFTDGKINYVHVISDPELYYHTKDDDNNPDGAIALRTNRYIRMNFENGELNSVEAKDRSDGIFHPENDETAQRQIEGFIFTPELRPLKPDFQMSPFLIQIPEHRPIDLPPAYVRFLNMP